MTNAHNDQILDIIIRNEQDAYDFLRQIYETELGNDVSKLHVQFEGWPKVQVKLTGKKYQSTITPSIMKAFLKLQDGLYKAYALAVYADSKHRLSDDEKKDLELIIKVSQGSSKFDGENIDWGNVLTGLISKMTSKHLMITLLFGLLCYFGTDAYKMFLDDKQAEREAQAQSDTTAKLVELNEKTLDVLAEHQKENRELIRQLVEQKPELEEIAIEAKETKREFFKQASDAEKINIQGVEVTGEQAKELAKKQRLSPAREFEEIRLDGMYRILNVNTELDTGFKVSIRNEASGQELIAEVQDNTFQSQYKKAIETATFEKRPVALDINAKQKVANGTIYDVVVIKAVLHKSTK
ncbi:hypothetical protein Q7Y30_00755 [Glaesserella parasuis]|nr:hypothetical protein [Glaesserella parasuis]